MGKSPLRAPAAFRMDVQDGFSRTGRCVLQELMDTRQAEFGLLVGLFVPALAADDSARNQQQGGTFLQADGGSVGSGMGEQSQGQAGRTEFRDSAAVAEKAGSVAGIGVAEGAELFVIAGDESRAGMDAAGGFDEAAIDAQTEFGHGVGFVDVGAARKVQFRRCERFPARR